MKSCAVSGCNNTKCSSSGVSFFPFPLNTNRCLQWLLMCNRKDLVTQTPETLNSQYSVCSLHFTPNSFVKNHKKLLKVNSIPTLHIKKDISYSDVVPTDCGTSISVFLQDNNFSGNSLDETFLTNNENSRSSEKNTVNDENSHLIFNICRLCSESNSESNSLFNILETANVLEKINACLPIKIFSTDCLPKNICTQCHKRLEKHFEFYRTVLESNNVLKEMFEKGYDEIVVKEDYQMKIESTPNQDIQNNHIYIEVLSDNTDLNGGMISLADDNMDAFSDDISENVIIETVEQMEDNKSDTDLINIVVNEEDSSNDHTLILENTPMYMCNSCNGLAPDVNTLYSHSINNHCTSEGNFVCVLCDSTTYFDKEELLLHMNLHIFSELTPDTKPDMFNPQPSAAESNKYLCRICGKRFKSKRRMEFHLEFHIEEKPGLCSLCNKTFADENLLYRHVLYLHRGGRAKRILSSSNKLDKEMKLSGTKSSKVKNISCSECSQKFDKQMVRLMHEETVHGIKRYCHECHHCKEAFANVAQLSVHIVNEHGHTAPEQDLNEIEISCLYQCEYCSRLYTNIACLDNHRLVFHSKNPAFLCRYCQEEFANYEEFLVHLSDSFSDVSHRKEEYPERPTSRKFFTCQYCLKTFQSLSKMMPHIERHKLGSLVLKCKPCGIVFTSTQDLDTHKAQCHPITGHEKELRLKSCNYCSKGFASEASLIKHIRTHTGEKPFICDFCGKGFSQSSGLITHTKVHREERPYLCTECNRSFKIKGDYNNHMKRHSGLRPYECKICHKTFITQNVYSQHCKIHTNSRPYECNVCGSAFRRSFTLNVHMLRHSGEKPHNCVMCEKHYRQRGDLLKHMKAQHGITSSSIRKFTPEDDL